MTPSREKKEMIELVIPAKLTKNQPDYSLAKNGPESVYVIKARQKKAQYDKDGNIRPGTGLVFGSASITAFDDSVMADWVSDQLGRDVEIVIRKKA